MSDINVEVITEQGNSVDVVESVDYVVETQNKSFSVTTNENAPTEVVVSNTPSTFTVETTRTNVQVFTEPREITVEVGNGAGQFLDSTDDLLEGTNNLYFSEERAQDAVFSNITGSGNVSVSYDDVNNTFDIDGSGLTGFPVTVGEKILYVYNAAGQVALSNVFGELGYDTVERVDDAYTYNPGDAVVTIEEDGLYEVMFEAYCRTTGSGRSSAEYRLMRDSGTGFVEVGGTRSGSYHRTSSNDDSTTNITRTIELQSGDELRVEAVAYGSVETKSDGVRLQIVKKNLFEEVNAVIQGPPGEDGVDGIPGDIIWTGPWSIGQYVENEAVSYEGSSYVANTTTNDEPPSVEWDLLAAKGEKGDVGAPDVYTGSFLIDGTGTINITGLGFAPHRVVFRASLPVDSENIGGKSGDNPSDDTGFAGNMNGFARKDDGVQKATCTGGSGASINNIRYGSSSTRSLYATYGDQNANERALLAGKISSWGNDGFTVTINTYSSFSSGMNGQVVHFTAYGSRDISGDATDISNNGSLVVSDVGDINFGTNLSVLDDGDGTVTVEGQPGYTDEEAQDAVFNNITGTSGINVVYDDAGDSFEIDGSGVGNPAGNTGEIQFNDAGMFGASNALTFDSTNNILDLNGTLRFNKIQVFETIGSLIVTGSNSDKVGSGFNGLFEVKSTSNGRKIIFDDNEIQAVNGAGDGSGNLYVQREGGSAVFGLGSDEKIISSTGLGIGVSPTSRLQVVHDGVSDYALFESSNGNKQVRVSSDSSGRPSLEFGQNASVSGSRSVAIGENSSAGSLWSHAIGYNTRAGSRAIALGDTAKATGNNSAALGANSRASGTASAAINTNRGEAKGQSSTAVGHLAGTNANYALTLGTGVLTSNFQELTNDVEGSVLLGADRLKHLHIFSDNDGCTSGVTIGAQPGSNGVANSATLDVRGQVRVGFVDSPSNLNFVANGAVGSGTSDVTYKVWSVAFDGSRSFASVLDVDNIDFSVSGSGGNRQLRWDGVAGAKQYIIERTNQSGTTLDEGLTTIDVRTSDNKFNDDDSWTKQSWSDLGYSGPPTRNETGDIQVDGRIKVGQLENTTTKDEVVVRNPSTKELEYVDGNTFSGTPSGSDREIQFNDNGNFGADSGLFFDNNVLTSPGIVLDGPEGLVMTFEDDIPVTATKTTTSPGFNFFKYTIIGEFLDGSRTGGSQGAIVKEMPFLDNNNYVDLSWTANTDVSKYIIVKQDLNVFIGEFGTPVIVDEITNPNTTTYQHTGGNTGNTLTSLDNTTKGEITLAPQEIPTGFGDIMLMNSDGGVGVASEDKHARYEGVGAFTFGTRLNGSTVGDNSLAFGEEVVAEQINSFAFGLQAKATGSASIAIGRENEASGLYALALGSRTVASSGSAMSTGANTVSSGEHSFTSGLQNVASGKRTAAFGQKTVSRGYGSFVQGLFNEDYIGENNEPDRIKNLSASDRMFAVGVGDDPAASDGDNRYFDGLDTGDGFFVTYRDGAVSRGGFSVERFETDSNGDYVKTNGVTNTILELKIPDEISTTTDKSEVLVRNPTSKEVEIVDGNTIGGNPAGNNTEIQFNDNGVFGASTNLTFDTGTNEFTIGGELVVNAQQGFGGYASIINQSNTAGRGVLVDMTGSGSGEPILEIRPDSINPSVFVSGEGDFGLGIEAYSERLHVVGYDNKDLLLLESTANSTQLIIPDEIVTGTNTSEILVRNPTSKELEFVSASDVTGAASRASISDGGTQVLSSPTNINFGTDLTVVDDTDGTVTVNYSGSGVGYTDEDARDAVGAALVGGTNVTVTVDDVNDIITVDSTDTDTTYTAGTLLSLSGTEFNVENDLSLYDNSTSGFITDYMVTQSDVTQYESALTITESQISDLSHYTSENARDDIGMALTAGANVTIDVDDGNNTITISSTDTNTDTQLSNEEVQDIVGGFVTGVGATTVTYDDNSNTLEVSSSDTNTQRTNEEIQDVIFNNITGSGSTSVTYDDANGTFDISSTSGTGGLTKEEVQDEIDAVIVAGNNLSKTYNDSVGTLTLDATDTNTQLSNEQVQDIVGGFVIGAGATTVTYNDTSNTLEISSTDTNTDTTYSAGTLLSLSGTTFNVNNDLSQYDNSTSGFITDYTVTQSDVTQYESNLTITESQISDLQHYTAENARDDVGAALVGGSNVTVAVDDANNTITIDSTNTDTQLTNEEVEDIVGGLVTGSGATTVTYNDAGNSLEISSTDTDTQRSDEEIRDVASAQLVGGTDISLDKDDVANTVTINSTPAASASLPVGSIIVWPKNTTGVGSVPSSYVECNGQTLNDSSSPLDGETIPNLNGNPPFTESVWIIKVK